MQIFQSLDGAKLIDADTKKKLFLAWFGKEDIVVFDLNGNEVDRVEINCGPTTESFAKKMIFYYKMRNVQLGETLKNG